MNTLLLLALLTAPGDPLALYVTLPEEPVLVLTEGVEKLGTAVKALWPSIIKSNLTKFGCHRPDGGPVATCSGGEETVPTDEQLLTMVVAGKVSGTQDKPWEADDVALAVLKPFAEYVFGCDVSEIYQIKAWRDPEAPAIIWAQVYRLKIASATAWRADRDAGVVVLTLAKLVEE